MLFRLTDVHKSYGAHDVLRGVSFQINPAEHVGLVGRNGAGKTTIFRLVTGEETADNGEVARARALKLGLLAQHVHFKAGATVHESALSAFGRLQQIEHEMHELEHRMADAGDDLEKVLERYSDLQHEFEREGGFEYSAKAETILQGLGFDRDSWQLETDKLSGGQQNRLGLACLLLSDPDVLLLDEPTNHLVCHNFARSLLSRSCLPPNCRSRKWPGHQLQRQLLALSPRTRRAARNSAARLREPAAPDRQDRRVHS
jgi:ATP-binding cassette subfamily F protein 3